MTAALSPVADASRRLADAVRTAVPGLRVTTSVSAPITPPAVVVGPPRLSWRAYGCVGVPTTGRQPTTGQWNVYLVTALNPSAVDVLLGYVDLITAAIESRTPGVVTGAGPGVYPSPSGGLPSYVITAQMEINQ